jgi:NAD(P)-dependent dehydrogenase (short-subunit alcohol dehydrogenase family)
MDWHGKVAVVTGGASGIGAAAAKLFASLGAKVVVVDRDAAEGAETASDSMLLLRGDVGSEADVARVRDVVVERFGRIDVLLNNAGIMRRHERAWDWSTAEVQEVLTVNLLSQFITIQLLAPVMEQGGGGSIVNIASMGALIPVPYSPAYAASKAGVLGMTRSMADSLNTIGVRINAILPGFVDTSMTVDAPARAFMPAMDAADVARAIAHVAADPSVTGGFFEVGLEEGSAVLNRIEDTPRVVRVQGF